MFLAYFYVFYICLYGFFHIFIVFCMFLYMFILFYGFLCVFVYVQICLRFCLYISICFLYISIYFEAPEFWALLEQIDMQFYQQPSGFDDNIICCWKVEHQASQAPCSIRVVDSFAGGLSPEVRKMAGLLNQTIPVIEANMTAAVQVTDTDVAFRLKSAQRRHEEGLRKELMRLAELEERRIMDRIFFNIFLFFLYL